MQIEEDVFREGNHEIAVLPSLLAIRKRPEMYMMGQTHQQRWQWLLQEAIKYMSEPHFCNKATQIHVSVYPNNIIYIRDNGRGLPIYPSTTGFDVVKNIRETEFGIVRPSLEIILTQILAGSPPSVEDAKKIYEKAGFLCGFGPILVSFAGTLRLTTYFGGNKYQIAFWEGSIAELLKCKGPIKNGEVGTSFKFTPSTKIFGDVDINLDSLSSECTRIEKLFGVTIHYRDLR